ncbi:MAG: hypothetical protein WA172_03340 [Terriglobales bacterium]
MAEMRYVLNAGCDSSNPPTIAQQEVLERAVAKLVRVAARAGVSTDEMIEWLESGMSVPELLEYVLALTEYVV